jgi:hypothetical protein
VGSDEGIEGFGVRDPQELPDARGVQIFPEVAPPISLVFRDLGVVEDSTTGAASRWAVGEHCHICASLGAVVTHYHDGGKAT